MSGQPDEPCCGYRDHGDDMGCACPNHWHSAQHPFGELPDEDPTRDDEAFEGWGAA